MYVLIESELVGEEERDESKNPVLSASPTLTSELGVGRNSFFGGFPAKHRWIRADFGLAPVPP